MKGKWSVVNTYYKKNANHLVASLMGINIDKKNLEVG